MAKKDNSPAISFFSFQDIITSITGIMFLVVMMLVLMILNQSGVTGAEKQVRADLRQLNRELEELQSMVTQFEKTSRLQQEQITKLQQLKLETLPEKKRTLIAVLQDMDNAIRQAAKDESTFLKLQEKERINGEKQAAETLRLAENNRQLEKTLLRQEKNHELYRKIMQMAWDKGNPKRPVFLECGKDSICTVFSGFGYLSGMVPHAFTGRSLLYTPLETVVFCLRGETFTGIAEIRVRAGQRSSAG